MNIVFGSLPISAWEDSSVGGKIQPYNLIDTDISCYWKGFCPMFPPGGELSAFPNGEEKFQHILHNLHRMFTNCSRETSIGRYTYGGNTRGGLLKWCPGCKYCGKSVSGRKPLYWYSDANAAARFKQWDEKECDQAWYKEIGESAHSTCKWGLVEVTMWGKGIYSIVPRDRCSLLSSNINQCQFSARASKFCSDDKDRCWFETEGICGGNSCLMDPHCEPVFAGKYDYVGKGFIGGMNGVDSVYSRFTKEIYYLLPIAAHFDARIHTAPIDYRSDGKYFNLMLEYHDTNTTQTVLTCYALFAGDMTEMSVYMSGTSSSQCSSEYYGSNNEFSVMFYAYYTPHISCEPYAFICETSQNIFVRLPQQDSYYFGTDWIDWVWSNYSSYGYEECKEQHYYNHPSEGWTVNGGEKLIQSEIWYYHNGGECIGCEKIEVLNCLQDCIYNYNVTQLCKRNCQAATSTPIPTQPTTCEPTSSATNSLIQASTKQLLSPIENMDTSGETCTSILNWSYKWKGITKWNENMSSALKSVAEAVFIAQHSECDDSNDLEYYYYFSWGGLTSISYRPKLRIFMLICCGEGTFGPDYEIPSDVPQKDKYIYAAN